MKRFTVRHVNAWRMHRQWLDRPFKGRNLIDLVRSIGWIYSPGCSTPYLSVWARTHNFRPSKLDRLVFEERGLIQLETLRGCTMLVPRDEAPVALRIRSRTFTELAKEARPLMPISGKELERLKTSVLAALEGGFKTHDEIRDAVPSELIRDFPAALKRIGFTGSLWLAFHLLKEDGRIVKIQHSKRLDTTDYAFARISDILPEVDPFDLKPEIANVKLAQHYFRSEGPARVKDLAWWAGINVTEAMRATEQVSPGLEKLTVANSKDEFLLSPEQLDEFADFVPGEPGINLIPYRDVYLKGQREVVNRFVRQEHSDKPFSRWKGKLINDPLATVIVGGQVMGVWEWDPSGGGRLHSELFAKSVDKKSGSLIRKRADELGRFIRDELQDIRLQGVDYGRHQMTKIRELKTYWGQGAHADVETV